MAKHTPGPWAVLHASFEDSEENGAHVPVVSYAVAARDMNICAANARLIAAAPDMLKALREVEADHNANWNEVSTETMGKVHAVIDAATTAPVCK